MQQTFIIYALSAFPSSLSPNHVYSTYYYRVREISFSSLFPALQIHGLFFSFLFPFSLSLSLSLSYLLTSKYVLSKIWTALVVRQRWIFFFTIFYFLFSLFFLIKSPPPTLLHEIQTRLPLYIINHHPLGHEGKKKKRQQQNTKKYTEIEIFQIISTCFLLQISWNLNNQPHFTPEKEKTLGLSSSFFFKKKNGHSNHSIKEGKPIPQSHHNFYETLLTLSWKLRLPMLSRKWS